MGLEVGYADGPGPALAVELLQRPPGLHEVTAVPGRQRPVDQEQVDVLGAESLERPFEGLAGIAGLGRRAHRGRRVLRRDLKDTEAELRNGLAVVQPDIRNGSHEELSSARIA